MNDWAFVLDADGSVFVGRLGANVFPRTLRLRTGDGFGRRLADDDPVTRAVLWHQLEGRRCRVLRMATASPDAIDSLLGRQRDAVLARLRRLPRLTVPRLPNKPVSRSVILAADFLRALEARLLEPVPKDVDDASLDLYVRGVKWLRIALKDGQWTANRSEPEFADELGMRVWIVQGR